MSSKIIDLAHWFDTPAGQHLHNWQMQHVTQAVANCFGYHALQVGMEHVDFLAESRVQHHWHAAVDCTDNAAVQLVLDPRALPFDANSLDLVLLPYTLEASADPHAVLREVERVLVPEGRLVVLGFNPASLWGLQQAYSGVLQRLGADTLPFIPDVDDLIGVGRLRDWMRLLSLQVDGGRFGCYRPGVASPKWFERWQWLEKAGDRWWPMCGGVYLLEAVKRVQGVRMLQPRWKLAKASRAATTVAQRQETQKVKHHD